MAQRTRVGLIVLFVLAVAVGIVAQGKNTADRKSTPPMSVRCVNIAGSHIAAPKWELEADGMRGQDVRLEFGGDGAPSKIAWRSDGEQYYEADGVGFSMRAGFLIVIPADDYVETYVYNAGTTDLLFSATRSGSSLLPNGIKAFRGACSHGR